MGDMMRLPTVRDHGRVVLVVHDGHVVGSRQMGFGRFIRALPLEPVAPVWDQYDVVPPFVTFDDRGRDFELQRFGMRLGDVVHQIFAVVGDPDFDLVESDDIPAPFDRFKVGGERLPDQKAHG